MLGFFLGKCCFFLGNSKFFEGVNVPSWYGVSARKWDRVDSDAVYLALWRENCLYQWLVYRVSRFLQLIFLVL